MRGHRRHPNKVMTRQRGCVTAALGVADKKSRRHAWTNRSQALDHVVVVMFENRLFDNLLGRLYEPGQVRSFEA